MTKFILLCTALALTGCKNKDADKAASGGGESSAIDFEPVKLVTDKVVVEAASPKGFDKSELSKTDWSWVQKGSIFGSNVTISATCGGSCDTIAANLRTLGDAQVTAQKANGYEAAVTKTAPLPNGIEFDFKGTMNGRNTIHGYVRFVHDPKLPMGAQCMVIGVGKQAEADRDRLKAACAGLAVKPV